MYVYIYVYCTYNYIYNIIIIYIYMCIYPLLYFANIYEHLLCSASTKIYQDLYIDSHIYSIHIEERTYQLHHFGTRHHVLGGQISVIHGSPEVQGVAKRFNGDR